MLYGYTPLDFQQFKIVALEATGLAKDALHIYAGMALFISIRLLWRWRGGWALAWLAVLAMACTVEWIDMKAEGAANALQPDAAHWHDIWNTMFWPTVLLLDFLDALDQVVLLFEHQVHQAASSKFE